MTKLYCEMNVPKGILVELSYNSNISHILNAILHHGLKVTNAGVMSFVLLVSYLFEDIWLCVFDSYHQLGNLATKVVKHIFTRYSTIYKSYKCYLLEQIEDTL